MLVDEAIRGRDPGGREITEHTQLRSYSRCQMMQSRLVGLFGGLDSVIFGLGSSTFPERQDKMHAKIRLQPSFQGCVVGNVCKRAASLVWA